MQKRRILINSIMSILQIIVVSGTLFVLYKFILDNLGAENFGIWSLVLAATAVTQIADLGLSGGVVKFVAQYIARDEDETVSRVIQTAVLTIGVTVGVVLFLAFPLIKWVLGMVMPVHSLPVALDLLPFAFIALWLCVITSIFQSGLDGYQRFDIRSILLMSGSIFHLLLCFWMVPRYGIMGLAYAKIIQNASVLTASWLSLKKCMPLLPVLPIQWNKSLFKEMISYCLQFQVITVASMLYDPITKALLSKFGSLSMIGFYQMASKMIQKLHSLIIAANQVLVPAIAGLKEKTPDRIKSVYITSYRLLFYLTFPLYLILIIGLPLISEIWLGYQEGTFIVFGKMLAFGWMLATLASPAYHANLGIGKLRWNVWSTLTTAGLNTGLGIFLGYFFKGHGVVTAWMLSLILGSAVVYLSYHIQHHIPLRELIPNSSRSSIVACIIGTITALVVRHELTGILPSLMLHILALILFMTVILVPHWRHPMRKSLTGWISKELLRSR